jgi:hypothetical protein
MGESAIMEPNYDSQMHSHMHFHFRNYTCVGISNVHSLGWKGKQAPN